MVRAIEVFPTCGDPRRHTSERNSGLKTKKRDMIVCGFYKKNVNNSTKKSSLEIINVKLKKHEGLVTRLLR